MSVTYFIPTSYQIWLRHICFHFLQTDSMEMITMPIIKPKFHTMAPELKVLLSFCLSYWPTLGDIQYEAQCHMGLWKAK